MASPRYRGPDTRFSPARPRLAHHLSAYSTRRCGIAVGGAVAACARVKGPLQVGTQPTRHGSHGQQDGARHRSRGRPRRRRGPGAVVRSSWSATTPARRPRGHVRRRPGPGHRRGGCARRRPAPTRRLCLGVVKGRRALGQPGLGRVQRRPRLRPARASAAPWRRLRQGRRSAHAGPPGQPLGRGRPPSARLFSFLALAVVGEASKATTAMAAVAHPCSREEQP
jgi:hypothetical protein